MTQSNEIVDHIVDHVVHDVVNQIVDNNVDHVVHHVVHHVVNEIVDKTAKGIILVSSAFSLWSLSFFLIFEKFSIKFILFTRS